jgi:hypothetical protein
LPQGYPLVLAEQPLLGEVVVSAYESSRMRRGTHREVLVVVRPTRQQLVGLLVETPLLVRVVAVAVPETSSTT